MLCKKKTCHSLVNLIHFVNRNLPNFKFKAHLNHQYLKKKNKKNSQKMYPSFFKLTNKLVLIILFTFYNSMMKHCIQYQIHFTI